MFSAKAGAISGPGLFAEPEAASPLGKRSPLIGEPRPRRPNHARPPNQNPSRRGGSRSKRIRRPATASALASRDPDTLPNRMSSYSG